MECNVIKDLIPLYIDDCCSKESAQIIENHIEICSSCKALYESMNSPDNITTVVSAPKKLSKINDWKASMLQSVLLFISFAIITVGVAFEAATPSGFTNSLCALWLVVPTTGFMLSLSNWYFIKVYKSKKAFSNASCALTLGIIIAAYIWACIHYGINLFLFKDGFNDFLAVISYWFGPGFGLTALYCVLSKFLSGKYATMLGKE